MMTTPSDVVYSTRYGSPACRIVAEQRKTKPSAARDVQCRICPSSSTLNCRNTNSIDRAQSRIRRRVRQLGIERLAARSARRRVSRRPPKDRQSFPKPKEPQALACATSRGPRPCRHAVKPVVVDFGTGFLAPGRVLRVHYYGVEFAQLPIVPTRGLH